MEDLPAQCGANSGVVQTHSLSAPDLHLLRRLSLEHEANHAGDQAKRQGKNLAHYMHGTTEQAAGLALRLCRRGCLLLHHNRVCRYRG